MTREQADQRLEAWMNGELAHEDPQSIEIEFGPYPDLLAEFQLWQQMDDIPVDQPSPALSHRLDDMLDAFRTEALKKDAAQTPWTRWLYRCWPRQPAYSFAAAVLCLLLGVAGGWFAANSRSSSPRDTLLRVQRELQDTRELAVLAMLQQPMAGDRLHAVSYLTGMQSMHPTLQRALIRTLQQDGSVNVRLAALDALSRNASAMEVRLALQSALETETSQLVQVELLRVLAGIDHPQARQTVEQAAIDERFNESVRLAAGQFLQSDW